MLTAVRYLVIRSLGTVLCFTVDVSFFYFFHREVSELPRPIDVKLCHVIGSMFQFYDPDPKIWGGRSPPPNGGGKYVQN